MTLTYTVHTRNATGIVYLVLFTVDTGGFAVAGTQTAAVAF